MVEAFSEDLVRRITRLSQWQLRYWEELGIARPSIAGEAEGERLYSFLDLMRLKVASELRKIDSLPSDMVEMIDALEKRGFNDPLVTLRFYETKEGHRSVYFDPSFGGALAARGRQVDQTAETFDLPLRDVKTNLQETITQILERRTGQIAKVRSLQASAPVIEGTRVPTAKVASLADAGWGEDRILAAFPHLTRKDVRAAKKYERQRRAARSA